MFDVNDLVAELCEQEPKHLTFVPADVQLSDLAAPAIKALRGTLEMGNRQVK